MKAQIVFDRDNMNVQKIDVHVEFRHAFQTNGNKIKPHTEAIIWWTTEDGKRAGGTGIAFVHPNDAPEKRIGRKIALTRALWASGLTREERRQIWEWLLERGMRV